MSTPIKTSVPTATGTWQGNGIIWKEYNLGTQREVGATRNDIKFSNEREFKHIDFNGQYGEIEGNKRITKSIPVLTFGLLELTYTNFEDCFAGLNVQNAGNYHEITEDMAIAPGDYHENITWAGVRDDNKYAMIQIQHALGDGKMEFNIKAHEDIVLDIQFTAHYGKATMDEPPWLIRLEN
jgi:hypothetical protein